MAVAISYWYLKQAKFRKDFNIETTWNDEQAGHNSRLAGNIYAHSIEEVLGHIALAQVEFCQISLQWHYWLGFALPQ